MKYTVISISDKRKDNIDNTRSVMGDGGHDFVGDIEFVDGRIVNAFKLLNDFGIRTNVYKPDDGRSDPMTAGEAGCWMSHVRCIKYIVEHNLDEFLVLEDDAILENFFSDVLESVRLQLPEKWDFISFYSNSGQNLFSEESDIGSDLIHRSLTQYSMNQAMLYSKAGASKLLKIFNRSGATYNIDSVTYRASRNGFLNGYIVRPNIQHVVGHGHYESLIDPNNFRNV